MPAVRALLGDDVQDASVGEMPPVLPAASGAGALEHLALPFGVPGDVRQPAELAQAVEDGAVGGCVSSQDASSCQSFR